MKKIFSLLLVVAMLVSLSLVASADASNAVSVEVVETSTDIVATYYITNPTNVAGFTASLVYPSALTLDSYAAGADFVDCTITPATKSGQVKYTATFGTATDKYVTKSGKVEIISITFLRGGSDETVYTSGNFAYGTGLYAAKINFAGGSEIKNTNAGDASYFTAPVYTDNRAPAPVDDFVNDTTSAVEGTTITCAGRVGAEYLSQRYGVEFTADSTVGGSRAQVFYGAKPGDTVSDGLGGTKTFVFDDWDGTFEIILQGVHAGSKNFRFFVGSDYTDLSSKVVSE